MKQKLVTKDTWPEFLENHGTLGMLVYLELTMDNVSELEKMIKNKKSFEDLKNELIKFCKGRCELIKDTNKNWTFENYPEQ